MGTTVAIFYGKKQGKRRAGWYWDDAQDRGGSDFDRVSPMGPFADYRAAEQDALDTLGAAEVKGWSAEVPDHYPADWH
jgi:hypothetical protein